MLFQNLSVVLSNRELTKHTLIVTRLENRLQVTVRYFWRVNSRALPPSIAIMSSSLLVVWSFWLLVYLPVFECNKKKYANIIRIQINCFDDKNLAAISCTKHVWFPIEFICLNSTPNPQGINTGEMPTSTFLIRGCMVRFSHTTDTVSLRSVMSYFFSWITLPVFILCSFSLKN